MIRDGLWQRTQVIQLDIRRVQDVPVRAEVALLDGLSAHADYEETLRWLGKFSEPPRMTFITHGEPSAADALRCHIQNRLHWTCRVPEFLETVELE